MRHDQATNLRFKLKNHSIQPRDAKTISVISGKGGVGKSNVALNFAIDLLRHNHRVLVMDLDVGMGNIDILLGQHAEKTIVDLLHDRLEVQEIIVNGPENLAYISGGTGFTDFFSMSKMEIDHFLLEFQKLRSMFDYIIFDVGAGVTSESMFFILASDESIVITTPEPTAITDAYALVKQIVYREEGMPISIIMNRARVNQQGKRVLSRFQTIIRNFLHIETNALGVLPDDPTVSEAVSRQRPFILWKNRAPISKALRQITNHYITDTEEPDNKQHTSFVQKLKRLLMEM